METRQKNQSTSIAGKIWFFSFQHGLRLSVILHGKWFDNSEVLAREEQTMDIIDNLRSDLFRSSNGRASSMMNDIKSINNTAQRKVRELEHVKDKVAKVTDIMNVIDRVIGLVVTI